MNSIACVRGDQSRWSGAEGRTADRGITGCEIHVRQGRDACNTVIERLSTEGAGLVVLQDRVVLVVEYIVYLTAIYLSMFST